LFSKILILSITNKEIVKNSKSEPINSNSCVTLTELKNGRVKNADSKAQVSKSMAQLLKLNSAGSRATIAQLQKPNNSFTKIPQSSYHSQQPNFVKQNFIEMVANRRSFSVQRLNIPVTRALISKNKLPFS
jgi:hypothetical protein